MHLYLHDFAVLLGFLFVYRGMEKNSKTRYDFGLTSLQDFKFHLSVVLIFLSLSCTLDYDMN